LFAAQSLGLFVVFYYYVLLRIRPELFYQQQPQVFLFESYFFFDLVSHPGGIVDYVAAFLSPLFVWDWLGALVVTSLVTFICWATRALPAPGVRFTGKVTYLLPAILILMVLGQYIHPVRLCVGLGIAMLGANLYARASGCHIAVRIVVFAMASIAVYFAVAGIYVVFACLCGCHEWFAKRQRWFGAVCVLCAAVMPYAASWWPFDLIPGEAYRGLVILQGEHWLSIPSSAPKAVAIHTATLISPLLIAVFWTWRGRSVSEAPANRVESNDEPHSVANGSDRHRWWRRSVTPLAILLLVILADLVAFDYAKRCLLEIECNSEQRRWDEVLVWAEELPFPDARAYDPRILYCINRALYFNGDLLDKMFAYPQVLGTPSLTLIHKDIDTTSHLTPRQCSEVFFDLGRINESEQMTYEVLEQCGNRPEALKRLVNIYMIKGEAEAASRFLGLLDRSLLHRGWARQTRQQLFSDSASSDTSLALYRAMMVQRDSLGDASNVETLLKGLLERNPRNRMALEYLMAHYLLSRQLDKLLADRHRFDSLDYVGFPRHVDEALACYLAMSGQEDQDLGSRSIRPETWGRFVDFVEIERQSQGNPSAAFAALYPDFHDTYFFSFVFGHNIAPLGANRSPE
jgi:hypothetical protein